MPETGALRGRLVTLRRMDVSDAEWLRGTQVRDPEGVRDNAGYAIPARTARALESSITDAASRRSDELDLVIETHDGEAIGSIDTHNVNRRAGTFEYGLRVVPEHRRRGHASDAVVTLLRYCFEELAYQKANATVFAFNEASLAFHDKLGFVAEGRRRRATFTRGEYHDEVLVGMTREEFHDLHG